MQEPRALPHASRILISRGMTASSTRSEGPRCRSAGDTPTVFLEASAGVLAKAVVARLGGDAAADLVKRRPDRDALRRAIARSWNATMAEHQSVLARYDVNDGFLEHEGADEVARILLPGRAPDARNLAHACVRSLGGGNPAPPSDELVTPFATFLEYLTRELGRHPPFRAALHEVATQRRRPDDNADEREPCSGWSRGSGS